MARYEAASLREQGRKAQVRDRVRATRPLLGNGQALTVPVQGRLRHVVFKDQKAPARKEPTASDPGTVASYQAAAVTEDGVGGAKETGSKDPRGRSPYSRHGRPEGQLPNETADEALDRLLKEAKKEVTRTSTSPASCRVP